MSLFTESLFAHGALAWTAGLNLTFLSARRRCHGN